MLKLPIHLLFGVLALCGAAVVFRRKRGSAPENPGDGERRRPSWARTDDPERDRSWKTRLVLESVAARPGMHIADVGAGAGYFTFKLASSIGEKGMMYATDTDEEMVEHLRREKKRRGVTNLRVIQVPGHQRYELGLEPGSIDVLLAVNLFYPFYLTATDEARRFLERCHRALVPGGRLVLSNDTVRPRRGDGKGATVHLCGDMSIASVKALVGETFQIEREHSIDDSFRKEENEKPGYLLVLKKAFP